MLAALTDPVLPIFAVLAIGFLMQKAGFLDVGHAQAINRFVFYLGAPSLGVSVIGRATPGAIDWAPVFVYFLAELVVYALIFILMSRVFKRDRGEALLLGMTAVFANHIFFVLPIAERFYGAGAAQAMAGIILLDIAVIFCGSVILTEFLTGGNGGVRATLRGLARNPFVYAPPLGLLLGALGPAAPSGIWTFLEFTSAAAAPVTLFSLGITLASSPVFPIRLPCWTVATAKLVLLPALVWSGLTALGQPTTTLAPTITLLVAVGPCGALPFVIATQYGVRTVTIAKTVLISTLVSLVSLAVMLP